MRHQTKANRTFGINAGRERRMSAGNVEELAADVDRRRQVYRSDVEHMGNAGDPIKADRSEEIAALVPAIMALYSENPAARGVKAAIGRALGIDPNIVSRVVKEISEGRRDPFTGRLTNRGS